MPAISATAPGKIILFGEHAVVYGRPAIAVPVNQVAARVIVMANPRAAPGALRIQAPDIGLEADLSEIPGDHPLAYAINLVLDKIGARRAPACVLRIASTIPVASGMGSSAAVSVALLRAFSGFLGSPLPDEEVNQLAYQVEALYHGTPSGIDNSVITYNRPVFFLRGEPIRILDVPQPFSVVIGDTGISSPTSTTVGDVRCAWREDPDDYDSIFDQIGSISERARRAIEAGDPGYLGPLMVENHDLLRRLEVSSVELDRLIDAAMNAGALGAKMSGGGRGGNMIALVGTESVDQVTEALLESGAQRTIATTVGVHP